MGEILPDETDTFNFFLDLSAIDVYNIEVLAVLLLDEDPSNDTISISVEHTTPVVIFPYSEDFESFAPCGNNFGPCGFDCMVATANGWIQDAGDGDDWRIGFGTTGSGGTGPDQDHNPGTPTGQYLFTEASGCQGVTSILISPCFDLSNLGDPYVDFYVHMFGSDMGTMSLQITMDGGHTWMELWSTTGQLQTAGDEPWALQEVSLNQPPGIIQLRWIGLTGPGFLSDMALDDVRIYDRQYATCFLDSIFVDNALIDMPIDLYRASSYIEINALIQSGRNIIFKSGIEINYVFPFAIEAGATHVAEIEFCEHE
ncbi:MAG: hypothetical protein HKN76_00760 [Saprospiraceae bacterium]|nr:hypothetical protein [Saprospiraceae bacterium]